jgi:hypothetical protein
MSVVLSVVLRSAPFAVTAPANVARSEPNVSCVTLFRSNTRSTADVVPTNGLVTRTVPTNVGKMNVPAGLVPAVTSESGTAPATSVPMVVSPVIVVTLFCVAVVSVPPTFVNVPVVTTRK